jgi:hypothetical protein
MDLKIMYFKPFWILQVHVTLNIFLDGINSRYIKVALYL